MDINDFKDELESIGDVEIQNLTCDVLKRAPPHFWYRPASSTGKYHAKEENESGGIIIHTKRVYEVALILLDAWLPTNEDHLPPNPDVVKSASLIHDVCKYGDGPSSYKWTLSNHPKLAADFVKKIAGDKYNENKVNAISNAVLSHSGRWGKPLPSSTEGLMVHLADVIATRIHK